LAASTRPADFELGFRMSKAAAPRQPTGAMAAVAAPALAHAGASSGPLAGNGMENMLGNNLLGSNNALGSNPLGTGANLPPIATSPTGHSAVTSPSPLGGDTVFGSGFESLFGG